MLTIRLRRSMAIWLLALLPVGVSCAAPVYTGSATAAIQGPSFGFVVNQDQGMSTIPAGYIAAELGNVAKSLSLSNHGGTVDASAQSSGRISVYGDQGLANADTTIQYRAFLVALPGAPLDAVVPIHAVESGYAEAFDLTGGNVSSSVNASVFLSLIINGAGGISRSTFSNPDGSRSTIAIDLNFGLLAGGFVDVDLHTAASAAGADPALAHAFADPVFTIDPAYAAFFELVGVPADEVVTPPSTGVPEPSTWMLMVVGLVALVGGGRGRRTGRRAMGATRFGRLWQSDAGVVVLA